MRREYWWKHSATPDEARRMVAADRIATVVATALLLIVLGAVGAVLAFMAYVALG